MTPSPEHDTYAYAICWWPSSDIHDYDIDEIVISVAVNVESALIAAEHLALQKATDQAEWDNKTETYTPLSVLGLAAARQQLAANPYEGVHMEVGSDSRARRGGWIYITPRPLEKLERNDIPVDDGKPLKELHFIYKSQGAHPLEPPVGWAVMSESSLLIGDSLDNITVTTFTRFSEALASVEALLGRPWTGNIYGVDEGFGTPDTAWLRSHDTWRSVDPDDTFAQRALEAFHGRERYADSLTAASIVVNGSHLEAVYNEQCLLVRDAATNTGPSVAVDTQSAVEGVLDALQKAPECIFVKTKMGTFSYDTATDSFERQDEQLHVFIKTALAELEQLTEAA